MTKELSILQNFRDSMLRREPFPYLVIENALPAELYDRLAASYPAETLIFQHHRHQMANPTYESNTRYDLSASSILADPSMDIGLWRAFTEYHTSQEFFDEVLEKLGEVIEGTHPGLIARMAAKSPSGKPRAGVRYHGDGKDQCEIALDSQVGINSPVTQQPNSVRAAHLDNPVELYAGLFYLRRPEDDSEGGTLEIYSWKNPARKRIGAGRLVPLDYVETCEAVAYGPNRFALFINSLNSIHGVTVRGKTDFPRRLVNIIGEVYPTMTKLFSDRPFRDDKGVMNFLKRSLFGHPAA